MDDTVTMVPLRAVRMAGARACTMAAAPHTLVSNISRATCRSPFSCGPIIA